LAVKLELEPDLKILNLNHDDGKLTGLQLNWQTDVTYMLEASSNLTTWREVTSFYAGSGTVSFPSLSESGPFFRVRVSEIPSSFMFATASEQATANIIVKDAKFEIKEGRVAAVFPSQEGASYIVEFLSTHGKPLKKMEVVGTPVKTRILLPSDLSATTVLLRVSIPLSYVQ
jgi:hypothetical protein